MAGLAIIHADHDVSAVFPAIVGRQAARRRRDAWSLCAYNYHAINLFFM